MLDKYQVKDILKQIVKSSIHEVGKNYNFRCPVCGDSKKSLSKRRGWVLFDNDKTTYHCFNCNISQSFNRFLKENYPNLYSQYVKNKDVKTILKLNKKDISVVVKKTTEDITSEFMANSFDIHDKNIDKKKKMIQYEALKFAVSRKIPKQYIAQMRVCYDGKFKDRLLIPYCNLDENEVYCFQGRTLVGKEPKYLTNKPDNNTKIFNFYNVIPEETVYITEGPIDAMFIDNCIATSGIVNYDTAQYKEISEKFDKRVWVFDNDITGINMAIKYAEKCENVFCWDGCEGIKDINELVLKKRLTNEDVKRIIDRDTFTKFKAVMKLKM